ncbi:M48 family metallopeptidase [Streptomyces sp. YIM S03343]
MSLILDPSGMGRESMMGRPSSDGGSAVREWLLVVAMLGLAWGPFVLLGVSALLIMAFTQIWAAAGPFGLMAVTAVRGFTERPPLPGRAVRPEDEPELAALVQDVAERLGFHGPLLVRIVPDPAAAMARVRIRGVRTYVMVLGLPLLRALTEAQMASVIAHELAHDQHVRHLRSNLLALARDVLAERLDGRLRLLAPLAAPLLRASQPSVWRAETAADAEAARVAGTVATAEALELTGPLHTMFHGLGATWWSALEREGTYPEDFYDALDTARRDPFVSRRAARWAAEEESLDPYATADHPPSGTRVAALPHTDASDASDAFRAVPLTLRTGTAIERWCVGRLAAPDEHVTLDGVWETRRAETAGTSRPTAPGAHSSLRAVQLLELDPGCAHSSTSSSTVPAHCPSWS